MNAMVVGALSPEVISLIVRAGSLDAGAPRAIEDVESQAAKINKNRVIGYQLYPHNRSSQYVLCENLL